MQIHVGQYYNTGRVDSVLSDTRTTSGPLMERMDSASIPPAYYEILSQLKSKDSLVIRIVTDSAFQKSPQGMPPGFKKGHYLITKVKVVNVFTDQRSADSARVYEMQAASRRDSLKTIEMGAKDDKTLLEYFKKNNIKVQKSPMGTYVEIIRQGTGPQIDTNVVVSTNYTGRTMDGKMFDSNTDPAKGHVEPFNVNLTSDRSLGGSVIKGWTDGLKLLNEGTQAKFYIPSSLAYGARSTGDIPPHAILIFDIEVLKVYNREEAKKIAKEDMEKQRLKQKAMMDSLQKASKAAGPDTLKRP